jgi:hypothetical protein
MMQFEHVPRSDANAGASELEQSKADTPPKARGKTEGKA